MSLMGYTEEDIYKMMASINVAMEYLHDFKSENAVLKELQNAFDFLDGMLVEGRI
jgi:hypothetical protein